MLARSLDRRALLSGEIRDGPVLIVAERIDAIARELARRGWEDQFHPSYSRMVPAHHVTTLRLVGCPDPNPVHKRFFDPPRETLPNDLDLIGRYYIEAVYSELRRWLAVQNPTASIGIPFSGGIDSGAILLCLYKLLLNKGHSPARLKAFTLAVDGEGEDARQAHEFLSATSLEMLGEIVEVPSSAVDPLRAVSVIEDYKPLDVECAAVNLALLAGIRDRYPTGACSSTATAAMRISRTTRSRKTVSSRFGAWSTTACSPGSWGVDSIKHSLTYSGGYSRGCVRSYACSREHGFDGSARTRGHP